jgi:hypothetical protein
MLVRNFPWWIPTSTCGEQNRGLNLNSKKQRSLYWQAIRSQASSPFASTIPEQQGKENQNENLTKRPLATLFVAALTFSVVPAAVADCDQLLEISV